VLDTQLTAGAPRMGERDSLIEVSAPHPGDRVVLTGFGHVSTLTALEHAKGRPAEADRPHESEFAVPLRSRGGTRRDYLPKPLYRELNFSTRPALSRMRCLPV